MDFGDRLDVGVGVERHHSVLVPEDGLERLDIAALADPLRCERVAKDVERDQLFVGAHEAVGLRERLERPADIACRREGRARFRQDVAVPDLDRPGKAARAQLPAIGLVNLLQEGEKADRSMGMALESWVLVSLMKEPIPFAYATECLIEIGPVSKSTSHHRRPQTSPIRIPVCRASTTAF